MPRSSVNSWGQEVFWLFNSQCSYYPSSGGKTLIGALFSFQLSLDQRNGCVLFNDKPLHDNANKIACAPSKDWSAWESAHFDQSSLSTWRKLGSLPTRWVHSEDSDQTGLMPRLIRVFAGRLSFCWFFHEVAQIRDNFLYFSILRFVVGTN